MAFNSYIPFDLKDDFMKCHIVCDLTALDLIVLVNLLEDINRELKKPWFMRLWNYRRQVELLKYQEEIQDALTRKLFTMRELFDLRQSYDKQTIEED